ncbi:hypothetical protein V5799_026850 [Amblyomma americanum]|uniref:ditrans,polycis-polyprenyl diphosphate synthase [(2E,6E)-farnesyldiphosphate specific] n=1 Tax=Amblyomma americanum TaxID=6943 RepID=A0AAQ4DHE3_AMBAM
MGAPSAVHSADGEECGVFGFVPVSWYERLLIWLLSLGPVPRTIGIIPDGNRRFARKHGVSVDDGHLAGSQVLSRVGTWCSLVGVKEAVIYVFSADNFTRPQSEQNGIFSEICRRCRHVLDNVDDFRKTGRRIRCAGDLERLPNDLQRCLARVDLATVNNAGCEHGPPHGSRAGRRRLPAWPTPLVDRWRAWRGVWLKLSRRGTYAQMTLRPSSSTATRPWKMETAWRCS